MADANSDLKPTYCINCGTKAKAIAKYCHACGSPVYRGTTSEISVPPPTELSPQTGTSSSVPSSTEAPEETTPPISPALDVSNGQTSQPETRINIQELPTRSTPGAILFLAITLGVWGAYFLNRLTESINAALEPRESHLYLSETLTVTITVSAWMNASLAVLSLFGSEILTVLSFFGHLTLQVCWLIWAFKVRNRLNTLLGSAPHSSSWFHGVPTFFFTIFYLTYKINCLKKSERDSFLGPCFFVNRTPGHRP